MGVPVELSLVIVQALLEELEDRAFARLMGEDKEIEILELDEAKDYYADLTASPPPPP